MDNTLRMPVQLSAHAGYCPLMVDTPLPGPGSEWLAVLISEDDLRMVYGLLHRRRDHPPTANEISYFLRAASIDRPVDQALHALSEYFHIATLIVDGEERYELRGWTGSKPIRNLVTISSRLRAETLTLGRCAMCGRSPSKHGVVLAVDLKFPPEWGGTNDRDNLWPLCEECKDGRHQFLSAYSPYAEQISRAAIFDEPQRRIGELLKAFNGRWVPSDLIGIIASAREYQEDYQRRIRDLRFLGWVIVQERRYHEGARVRVYYRLIHCESWPDNIRAAIAAEERRRKGVRP
jgi:hypothetical protein